MSPLRPTNASPSRSSAQAAGISPIGVMMCALATMVMVPVLITNGASSGGSDEVAAVVVPDTVSASELEADVDIDDLFDAGAKLDDVPEAPLDEQGVAAAAEAVAAAPQSLVAEGVVENDPVPQLEVVEEAASVQEPVTSTTISSAPATPAPAPTTTEAPVPAPTTTAAPVTEPPATEPATTQAPSTTEEPEPAVEAPQSVEEPAAEEAAEVAPNVPTAEQWAALRHCESSGNYSVVSRNGLYHGAYQFYQPTWDGLASQIGRTDLVGLAPSQAAPADQDALALLLWQQRGNQPWPHCGVHLPTGP